MIEPLKKYLFDQQYRKVKLENKSFLKNKINGLTSITILADGAKYDLQAMVESVNHFSKIGIDCDAFLTTDREDSVNNERVELINTKTECHWYNVPKPEMLIKWLQHKTDLLIVINPNRSRLIKYLCASSNSLLKSAVIFDDKWDRNVDFCLEAKQSADSNIQALVTGVYQELLKINKVVNT